MSNQIIGSAGETKKLNFIEPTNLLSTTMLSKNLLLGLISGAVVVAGGISAPFVSSNIHFNKGVQAEENGNVELAIQEYEKSKKADAYFRIGELYAQQTDIDSAAATKSFNAYQKSYDKGNKNAALFLAEAYINGTAPESNDTEAFRLAQEAEQMGDERAYTLLGHCYFNGIGVGRDDSKAFEYIQKSATRENPAGLYNLGICYLNGTGVTKDEKQAMNLIQQSADLAYQPAKDYLVQVEKEKQRKAQEEARARQYERSHTYMECPKCHGRGYVYNQSNQRSTCFMCWGQGVVTQDDIEGYANSIFSLPSW